jgi:predicted amidohydrolase
MKRKRGDMIGYQKDELLLETTALNISFNICFDIEHNIILFEYAKTKEVEVIFCLNRIVKQAIDSEKYIGMQDIILLCEANVQT